MIIKSLFPSVFQHLDIETFDKDTLVDYVYKQREENSEGLVRSNVGGWHSCDNYHTFDNPLNSFLMTGLKEIASIRMFKPKTTITVLQMWININNKGDYNKKHCHPNCDLSGTFWIKVPQNSGDLLFVNPSEFAEANLMDYYSEEFKDRFVVYPSFEFYPVEGRVCFWPSHLYHGVGRNDSGEDRISVAFNLNIGGSN